MSRINIEEDSKVNTYNTLEEVFDNDIQFIIDNSGDILFNTGSFDLWISIRDSSIGYIRNTEDYDREWSPYREFRGKITIEV